MTLPRHKRQRKKWLQLDNDDLKSIPRKLIGYEGQCLSSRKLVVYDALTLNNKLTLAIFFLTALYIYAGVSNEPII